MTIKTTQSAKIKLSFIILAGSFSLLASAVVFVIFYQNSKNQESYYINTSNSNGGNNSSISSNYCSIISKLNSQIINLGNLLKCQLSTKGDCKTVSIIQNNIDTLAKNNKCLPVDSFTPTPSTPTVNPTPGACKTVGSINPKDNCCSGLTYTYSCGEIYNNGKCTPTECQIPQAFCIKCGDGICSTGENKCNCPTDCK